MKVSKNKNDSINKKGDTQKETSLGVKILYIFLIIIITTFVLLGSASGLNGFGALAEVVLLVLFSPLIFLFVIIKHGWKKINQEPILAEGESIPIKMNLKKRVGEIKNYYSNNGTTENFDESYLVANYLDSNMQKIVSLGVGKGEELEVILKKFPTLRIKAIDLVPEFLKILREKNLTYNLNIVCGDFFDVVYENDNDAVIAINSLHYYTRDLKMRLYKKIFDSLKKDGKFISLDFYASDEEEESQYLAAYIKNIDENILIDTPLCMDNEKNILEYIGFKKIEILPIENTNYNILIAYRI